MPDTERDILPAPMIIPCRERSVNSLLSREWLLANRIGAYASSSIVGCNTRRYHGLLVAATQPPMGRIVALANLVEQVVIDGRTYDVSTNEFLNTFSPRGFGHVVEFRDDAAATFLYQVGSCEILKEIVLADAANAVAVRYTVRGADATIRLRPLAAMRDFHHLRTSGESHQVTWEQVADGVAIQDRSQPMHPLNVLMSEGRFEPDPQWWRRFCYRADLLRGQEGYEDLCSPGVLTVDVEDGRPCQLTASLDEPVPVGFATTVERRRRRLAETVAGVGEQAGAFERRLAAASDAFCVNRGFPNAPSSPTILAGYHWFADWGRDAMIALPGLLLSTGRFETARRVFHTFASALDGGMIPNRFDDYSSSPHYNSIDASLWFIIAAERYVRATGDATFWRDTLQPAAEAILDAYQSGARFDIRADADGLLTGGSRQTQLTWMDAKLGEEVVTPRHGKAVEINALWYNAHRILAARCRGADEAAAERFAERAELIGPAFVQTFWNPPAGCLHDCISGETPDPSIRPNQIFAVSLPYSPLSAEQQTSVVGVVRERLLTPRGLRTLAPADPRYRGRYGTSWESRDRAYHQGTVWAWLLGPFVEAHLRAASFSDAAVAEATGWIEGFEEHLHEAGIGQISEIFDGDPPHRPRGCIAQAWSVAELLRVRSMIRTRSWTAEDAS